MVSPAVQFDGQPSLRIREIDFGNEDAVVAPDLVLRDRERQSGLGDAPAELGLELAVLDLVGEAISKDRRDLRQTTDTGTRTATNR